MLTAAGDPAPARRGRTAKLARILLFNLVAIGTGLLVLDVAVTKLDLVPLRALPDGIPHVGFASPVFVFAEPDGGDAAGSGAGVGAAARGAPAVPGPARPLTIAILGDSHHQYTDDLAETHQSVLVHRMLEDAGIPNRVVSLGTPRHAPIQELVAYEEIVKPAEHPDVAVFLLYGGNDLGEILRADDRPRAERDADGEARIADPVWLLSRVPGERCTDWPRDSRLLYLANSTAPNNWLLKVIAANRSVEVLGVPLAGRLELIRNLRRFTDGRLGYPGAVPAQFLHQAYLLHRYPEAFRREVGWRMELFFRELARRNPDTPAWVFFLPSAAGIGAVPAEDAPVLRDILERTGLQDLDVPALEAEALKLVREARRRSGAPVTVVDLTVALRAAAGEDGAPELYDAPTIHIDAPARRVVAREMARALIASMLPEDPGSSR